MKIKMEENKEEKKVEAKVQEPKKETVKKETKVTGTNNKKANNNVVIIGIVVAVVALIAIIAGVMVMGKDTPKTAVEKELKNVKNGVFATQVLSGFMQAENANQELVKLMFEKLEWKVLNEKEEGETATVELEITNKDFKTIMGNVMQKAFKSALTGGATEEDVINYIVEELKNEETEIVTENATIELKKEDGKWKVADEEKFAYALLPRFQEVMDALN